MQLQSYGPHLQNSNWDTACGPGARVDRSAFESVPTLIVSSNTLRFNASECAMQIADRQRCACSAGGCVMCRAKAWAHGLAHCRCLRIVQRELQLVAVRIDGSDAHCAAVTAQLQFLAQLVDVLLHGAVGEFGVAAPDGLGQLATPETHAGAGKSSQAIENSRAVNTIGLPSR